MFVGEVSKVKLYIAPVKPAPEGDGILSDAWWSESVTITG